tara:strand:- start:555 stop:1043 length:489 start_codon:yes stop_codon:yes gene_type:complete
MSGLHLFAISLFCLLGYSSLDESDLVSRFAVTENSHPRLFLSDRNVEQWHARIDSDPQLSAFADYVIEAAEGLLEKPVLKRELEGRRLLGVSRESLHRLLYWGMAYRLTGDERYVARAQTDMLAVAAFKDWNPTGSVLVCAETKAAGIALARTPKPEEIQRW